MPIAPCSQSLAYPTQNRITSAHGVRSFQRSRKDLLANEGSSRLLVHGQTGSAGVALNMRCNGAKNFMARIAIPNQPGRLTTKANALKPSLWKGDPFSATAFRRFCKR